MNKHFELLLYAVTDRGLGGGAVAAQVEQAILGGATMVQLREKSMTTRAFLKAAESVRRITERYKIPLIINDRLDIALAVDADGLHVGQDDLSAVTARRLLGGARILGVSVANRAEAVAAERAGADYLGAGAVFPTGTKPDAQTVECLELTAITRAVGIPVVAIGGIGADNLRTLAGTGIRGIAVVSALFGQADVQAAARNLRGLAQELFGR